MIRSLTKHEPHIKGYPRFQEIWVTLHTRLVIVVEGYLDHLEFREFYEYLRTKVAYTVSYIKREYTQEELTNARLLKMWISATFEPTGDQVGTEYEYPCPTCKAGRTAKGSLVLDLTDVPKGNDIAKTIAVDEWIVSERLASLIRESGVTGGELKPVQPHSKRNPSTAWYQIVNLPTVRVSEQTRYGDAFRPNIDVGKIKSPCGHVIGDIVFSELYVQANSWNGSDISRTAQSFGGQKCPYPHTLISQRFCRLLREHDIRGYEVEVARLV